MTFLVRLFILTAQTATYAYLTAPTAPGMIPVQQFGMPRIYQGYNLGFNPSFAPVVNPSLIPGLGSPFLSSPPLYTPLPSPLYSPYVQPSYFPSYPYSYFPNSGASYFPTSYNFPHFPSAGASAFPYSSSPHLASSTPPFDSYGVGERISLWTAGTDNAATGVGRREVIASATSSSGSDYEGGDRIAMAGDGGQETAYRTVRTPPSSGQPARTVQRPYGSSVSGRTRHERSAQSSPIWAPFIQRFKQCAPNCEPTGYAAEGSRNHASCHSGGHAIDVRGIYCHDTRRHYSALDQWDRFQQMVECMKGKMLFWGISGHHRVVRSGVIYRQSNPHPTLGHHDHAHFSLGCYDGHVW